MSKEKVDKVDYDEKCNIFNCESHSEDKNETNENTKINEKTEMQSNSSSIIAASEDFKYNTSLRKPTTRRSNKRPLIPDVMESFVEPFSSGGSTYNVDVTFEPSIDMMVNDFDDEQTLNEEEALAAMELQDPEEEIATLQKESEIPIEELLAKYQEFLPTTQIQTKPTKKSVKAAKQSKTKKCLEKHVNVDEKDNVPEQDSKYDTLGDVIVIDSGDEEGQMLKECDEPYIETEGIQNSNDEALIKSKQRRSHLMDLYPENYLSADDKRKAIHMESLFCGDETDDEDDYEPDTDFARKTIMVGSSYQAVIPIGLSKYGDVLPYENEDKLIWEPSQVSEKEVENYLMKSCEIKHFSTEISQRDDGEGNENIENNVLIDDSVDDQETVAEEMTMKCTGFEKQTNSVNSNTQPTRIVKDNEQALHLLVQCGYDFTEALRRKRLNAVPLNGAMSIWSEEECRKFEEGIQKFGKDFLKIRQHQVRTRSMRELVQFYYLWKKSERRDHDFADSDTVDHMDMYLNEGDYSSNVSTPNAHGISSISPTHNNKKGSNPIKNFSIMTGISNKNIFSQNWVNTVKDLD